MPPTGCRCDAAAGRSRALGTTLLTRLFADPDALAHAITRLNHERQPHSSPIPIHPAQVPRFAEARRGSMGFHAARRAVQCISREPNLACFSVIYEVRHRELVRTAGLEPALPWGKQILSLLRIPFRHVRKILSYQ